MRKVIIPLHPNTMHRMYSVSKTFASTAIGLLADEGRISLDDRVSGYFKDKLPGIRTLTCGNEHQDLLKMATLIPLLLIRKKTGIGFDLFQYQAQPSPALCLTMTHPAAMC